MQAKDPSQKKDVLYSLIAEGTSFFPAAFFAEEHVPAPPIGAAHTPSSPAFNPAGCTRCPLANTRQRVVFEPVSRTKPCFILSDFPHVLEESTQEGPLFAEKSPAGLVVKLVEKLGILAHCHFSFAIKCVPKNGIPVQTIPQCSAHLAAELQAVQPRVLLCFGHRALQALACLDSSIKVDNLGENQSSFLWNALGLQFKVFFLSSPSDLSAFPLWRASVWSFLQPQISQIILAPNEKTF